MRRLTAFFITFLLLISQLSVSAQTLALYYDGMVHNYTAEPVTLIVAGMTVESDMPPVILDDRTLVPVRPIVETLGGQVGWDGVNSTVTVTLEGRTVQMTINSKTAYINGVSTTTDVPPKIINDRTMIPVRFVAESLGLSADFDGTTRTVYVNVQNNSTSKKVNVIDISGSQNGGQYRVTIKADAAFSNYQTLSLSSPDRFVLDISNANLTAFKTSFDINCDYIQKVRSSNFDSTEGIVRVVVDLSKTASGAVSYSQDKKEIYIDFAVSETESRFSPSNPLL